MKRIAAKLLDWKAPLMVADLNLILWLGFRLQAAKWDADRDELNVYAGSFPGALIPTALLVAVSVFWACYNRRKRTCSLALCAHVAAIGLFSWWASFSTADVVSWTYTAPTGRGDGQVCVYVKAYNGHLSTVCQGGKYAAQDVAEVALPPPWAWVRLPSGNGYYGVEQGIRASFTDSGNWCLGVPNWTVVLFASAPLLVPIYSAARYRRWLLHGRCPFCGYDVRATPARCTECGRRQVGGRWVFEERVGSGKREPMTRYAFIALLATVAAAGCATYAGYRRIEEAARLSVKKAVLSRALSELQNRENAYALHNASSESGRRLFAYLRSRTSACVLRIRSMRNLRGECWMPLTAVVSGSPGEYATLELAWLEPDGWVAGIELENDDGVVLRVLWGDQIPKGAVGNFAGIEDVNFDLLDPAAGGVTRSDWTLGGAIAVPVSAFSKHPTFSLLDGTGGTSERAPIYVDLRPPDTNCD